MKYTISVRIEPKALEFIDSNLKKGESRSEFIINSTIKEATKREEEQKEDVK